MLWPFTLKSTYQWKKYHSCTTLHHTLYFKKKNCFHRHSPFFLCVSVVHQSPSLSAEMSPSFVTRPGWDWTVHPFSIRLTKLSRWRDPFIPAVQQSATRCNPSLHPKHRCKDAGYFSRMRVHTLLMYTQTEMYTEHAQLLCTLINLFADAHGNDINSCCGLYEHTSGLF